MIKGVFRDHKNLIPIKKRDHKNLMVEGLLAHVRKGLSLRLRPLLYWKA